MHSSPSNPDLLLYSDYLEEILLCLDTCTPLVLEDSSENFRNRFPEIYQIFVNSLLSKIVINSASLFTDTATGWRDKKKVENLSIENFVKQNQHHFSPKTNAIYENIKSHVESINLAPYRNIILAHRSKIETVLESRFSEHDGHSFERKITLKNLRKLSDLGVDFFNSAFIDLTFSLSGVSYPDSYKFINYVGLQSPYSIDDFLLEFSSQKII